MHPCPPERPLQYPLDRLATVASITVLRDYGQADHTVSMLRRSRRGPSTQDQAADVYRCRFCVTFRGLCCG